MSKYRATCNEVRKAARKDKRKWKEYICEDIVMWIERYHGEHRTREVHKMVRSTNRKWQPRQSTVRRETGEVLTERTEILNRWPAYCSNLNEVNIDPKSTEELVTSLQIISPQQVEEVDDSVLFTEIDWAIQKLKRNKSPGIDMVTGEMIQASGPKWIRAFHQVCNNTWESDIVPDTWKKSVLVTIHKKDSTQECKNYRKIALISHVEKVLMMLLNRRLQTQVEEDLADEQAGFGKDRSTFQQILTLR